MARQTLSNNEAGLAFRTKLNDNFTELYGSFVKNNIATTNPSASNDNTQGYSIGSTWINTVTGVAYRCFDATTNAAIWVAMGVTDHPGMLSGLFYGAQRGASVTTVTVTADLLYAVPIYIPHAINIQALAVRVNSGGTGNAKLGIYSNANGRPGTLLAQPATAVSVGTSAAAAVAALSANYFAAPGIYWLAVVFSSGPVMNAIGAGDAFVQGLIGNTSAASAVQGTAGPTGVTGVTTYAAGLPSSFGTGTPLSTPCPYAAIQVA